MDLCYDVYGKDRDYVDAHVRATNADYGGQDYYNVYHSPPSYYLKSCLTYREPKLSS